jgi:hypothetical protein
LPRGVYIYGEHMKLPDLDDAPASVWVCLLGELATAGSLGPRPSLGRLVQEGSTYGTTEIY